MTALNNPLRVSREIAGRTLTLETGRLAKQADGAVYATYGETSLLATAQSAKGRADLDFFPLTVEYREKTYAAGKVPGGFFKREMRPRDAEVLVARSIDRPLRPLFAESYRDEVQVIVNVFSYDRENDPGPLAGVASMAALSLSSIPYQGPGATVKVGYVDGQLVINPTTAQMATSGLELVVSGTKDAVTMVEAGAMELAEDVMADAILKGHEAIREICGMIDELVARAGKPKQAVPEARPNPWIPKVERQRQALATAMATPGKHAKKDAVQALQTKILEELVAGIADAAELTAAKKLVGEALHRLEGDIERRAIIEKGVRADGRKLDQIRPIEIELGVLARTHGSALFTRGETQALVSVTLGTGRDEQIVDGLVDEYSKRFMLHYNFPPFCVGEVRRLTGTSRREIGHGHLAERSLQMVMPAPEEFPYSVRVVSEILESNGSSSMASVCGGTLALMDAGCPVRAPVAGIAMGLIEDGSQHFILSDILGSEDHNGDMDFKVTGTEQGVTALQMDIKIKGLSAGLLRRALAQAKAGRLHILATMKAAISSARATISKWAPQIVMRTIPVEKIGALIGPGGKVIRALQTDYNVRIEVTDAGVVNIAGGPEANLDAAVKAVEAITGDAELGAVYTGKVVSIRDFGAFIEIFPGKEGLLHISNLGGGDKFVKNVSDVLAVGDEIEVKVVNIDDFGRVRLGRPEDEVQADDGSGKGGERRGRGERGERGGGRERGDRGDRGDRGERGRSARPTQDDSAPIEVGHIYEGAITGLKSYGVFVEVQPGRDGLCHVSEMLPADLKEPFGAYNKGDEIKVKVLDIDDQGRIKLSMRAAASDPAEPVGN